MNPNGMKSECYGWREWGKGEMETMYEGYPRWNVLVCESGQDGEGICTIWEANVMNAARGNAAVNIQGSTGAVLGTTKNDLQLIISVSRG